MRVEDGQFTIPTKFTVQFTLHTLNIAKSNVHREFALLEVLDIKLM